MTTLFFAAITALALTAPATEKPVTIVEGPQPPVRITRGTVLAPAEGPAVVLYAAVNQTDQEMEQFTVMALVFKADGTPKARQVAPGRRTLEPHETILERRPGGREAAEVRRNTRDTGHEEEVAAGKRVGHLEEPPVVDAMDRNPARVGDRAIGDHLRVWARPAWLLSLALRTLLGTGLSAGRSSWRLGLRLLCRAGDGCREDDRHAGENRTDEGIRHQEKGRCETRSTRWCIRRPARGR